MHYLVVAKVKDYPDVIELLKALTYNHPVEKDFWGKWEKIAGSLAEFAFNNKEEINDTIDDEDMSFDDKVSEYMDICGFRTGCYGEIYQKVSAHFDECSLGGRYVNKNFADVVPYQKVIDEYGEDAFVLPNYDFYYTEDNKCPFKPDDLVYVIDGHN